MPKLTRWPMFNQVLHRQELMDEMIERLGVDVLIAVRADKGQGFVRARARCRDCLHESECRQWLDSSPILPLPPDFCPNANFFRSCGLLGAYGLWREHRNTSR
jgi:hypothetical protein